MNVLDELNQIPILQVAEDLGLDVKRHRMVCPFHDEDTPSLVLYPHTNSFYCFGCAKTGNSISLYSEIKKLDIKSTIQAMAKDYINDFNPQKQYNAKKSTSTVSGLHTPTIRSIQSKEKPIAEIHSQIYESFRDFCLQQKSNEISQSGLEYLKRRGFTEKTIQDFRIFIIKDYTEVTWHLKQRFSTLDLQESGLYNQRNNLIFYAHSLIIPYYRNGRIVYLQGRVVGIPTEGTNRYSFLNNQPLTLFNADILKKTRIDDTVYVTEGAFDCIRLVQEGKIAVSLGTANIFKREWAKLFQRVNVVFYLDNDKAGHKAAEELEKIFTHFNISCTRKNLPDAYKDVNDYYTDKLGSNEQLGLF
jgi:DNA primase